LDRLARDRVSKGSLLVGQCHAQVRLIEAGACDIMLETKADDAAFRGVGLEISAALRNFATCLLMKICM